MAFLLSQNYDLRAIVRDIGMLCAAFTGCPPGAVGMLRAAPGGQDLPQSPGVGGDVSKAQHEEFRDYVAARGPALLRAAMLLTSDRAEAEDLLQSALAKTYLAWDRINDRAAVDGYVRRAMVNTQISWWRRRKLEIYPTDELPEQPVDDHTRRSELRDALGRALDKLPKRQRLAVMLRYYEDMSETEIADILGISVGTVKSTVSRAMAKLRVDTELEHDFAGALSVPHAGDDRAGPPQ
jgi:RNA polymerase sigma-70 factor (sigma-E family)